MGSIRSLEWSRLSSIPVSERKQSLAVELESNTPFLAGLWIPEQVDRKIIHSYTAAPTKETGAMALTLFAHFRLCFGATSRVPLLPDGTF